ncbi:Protein root UVB sensitive 6 [Hibiscus syriacus]|uniref:Protein root UVB sensitive 6 n=1 Tax=Hibiscus syriacus TaxID=106335 RepID=A0A6A3CXN6_HIBSY|nr:Protein root UVB sensitive 6 [Hibiscus syriacus]
MLISLKPKSAKSSHHKSKQKALSFPIPIANHHEAIPQLSNPHLSGVPPPRPRNAAYQRQPSLQCRLKYQRRSRHRRYLDSVMAENRRMELVGDEFRDSSLKLICYEEIDGRRWKYVAERDSFGNFKSNSMRALTLHTPQTPLDELMSFVRSYVVPEGFPDSVTPSYVPYMTWRALKHFFGGAMGVFTTQTLLSSVGISRDRATPGAVAINWILKDGAGRVGKMLFSRQGKKFDYDLKQLRFTGDLLMELGAGVELATAAVPHLFLPLACAANVLKNVAAVTSTSTRTPIYKAFAKGENIGDVTAKGECVGNIADLVCSVVLDTLNRARFTVAVESFLKTGQVPSLQEGNMKETILTLPWLKDRPVVLGSRFRDAFQDPGAYLAIEPLFEKERYIVTYNPSKGKVYALFKDQAKSDDILKAAFHANVLLHLIHSANNRQASSISQHEHLVPTTTDFEPHVAESCKMVSTSYGHFKNKAAEQGWRMSESLLNPDRARLH